MSSLLAKKLSDAQNAVDVCIRSWRETDLDVQLDNFKKWEAHIGVNMGFSWLWEADHNAYLCVLATWQTLIGGAERFFLLWQTDHDTQMCNHTIWEADHDARVRSHTTWEVFIDGDGCFLR